MPPVVEDGATLVEQGGQVLRHRCRGPGVGDCMEFPEGRDATVGACDPDRPGTPTHRVRLMGGEYPGAEVAQDLRPEKAHALRFKPMHAGGDVRPLDRVHSGEGVGDDVKRPVIVGQAGGLTVQGDERGVALVEGSEQPSEGGGGGGLGHVRGLDVSLEEGDNGGSLVNLVADLVEILLA